ncbi:CobW family GTP-binding protein [Herpetosiphon geysericola]|uniref:CobW/HypB/UreG nucleotide-binding domain-containing protein n=1 Tax=Herpetosiphon geysericola TaxID=70996 RepID=A0A0P6Y9L4_9CHLR|nr:GTP-binding protein [Herpetosiphon geysericola]KPL85885.1 hypothetical protein SE18_13265 [Herpetosiphon geysericola]
MRAAVLTGFLGTGKTTLLLAVANALADRGEYVAIIENERGSVGIDGRYLQSQGMTVRELRAGCVCCDLALPLQITVQRLSEHYEPDWLLLEASGIAKPELLKASLQHPMISQINWRFIALVDPVRFGKMWHDSYGLGQLLRGQINLADVIVLPKSDLVEPSVLEHVAAEIRSLRPDVPVIPFTADDPAATTLMLRAFSEPLR